MNQRKMIEWIGSHDVGISSNTMWYALMDVQYRDNDRPYDADDFSRCYDLYKFAELTQEDLHKIADTYPYWQPVIDVWDDLCLMYENRCWTAMGEAFDSMRDEIMRRKGFRKAQEGYWVKGGTR